MSKREEDFRKRAEQFADETSVRLEEKYQTRHDYLAGEEYGYQYALQHPQWKSVEEELPKQDGRYWCCDDDGGQEELIWKDGNWYGVLDAYPIYGITHWMPLPTPPQRKEDK